MSVRAWGGYSSVAVGVLVALGVGSVVVELVVRPFRKRARSRSSRRDHDHQGPGTDRAATKLTDLIGNTPLLRINCLSEATGIEIWAKCEFLNPGGSIKDRIALQIVREAETAGLIAPDTTPRCRVFEGTSGSTGISLATVARAMGYDAEIVLPDDTAVEKAQLIENMGATVVKVRPVSISNRAHYVNVARDRARQFTAQQGEGRARGLFVDQFESPMNWRTHYGTTGPEIWAQTAGRVRFFVAGAGTGGTMAGVGKFLKTRDERVQLVVADPPGSGLFNKVKHGVLFSDTEVEGKRRRHQVDTVVEGIGSNRMTGNLEEIMDVVDDAIKVTDAEAIRMSRKILEEEGLFLGSSSAVNLVASHKLAQALSADREATGAETPGWIVTILCDSGHRHLSKFWNDPFLARHGFLDSPPSLS